MKLWLYRVKQQIKSKTLCESLITFNEIVLIKMALPEIKIIVDCEGSHDNVDKNFIYRYIHILYRF